MARVALDVMGTDRGPAEMVSGALLAAEAGREVTLVGDREVLGPLLAGRGADLEVVHASEVIDMHDDPARALRLKPDASVLTAARLVADGRADALVSAGSTGAALAAAVIALGRIEGVLRPAIATAIPAPNHPALLLDSGANPEVRPEHLVQFGVMGSLASEIIYGVPNPRVGLLNIGEEPAKGRQLDRAAHALMSDSPVNFVGNVEGGDLAADAVDVIVTDGFTGNISLKFIEGTARFVAGVISRALARVPQEALPYLEAPLAELRMAAEPDEYGGAHLLGVRGGVVIGHGSSSGLAVSNAVRMAVEGVKGGLTERLQQGLSRL